MAKVVSTEVARVNGRVFGFVVFEFEYEKSRTIRLEVTLPDDYDCLSAQSQEWVFRNRVDAALRELSQESTKSHVYENLHW